MWNMPGRVPRFRVARGEDGELVGDVEELDRVAVVGPLEDDEPPPEATSGNFNDVFGLVEGLANIHLKVKHCGGFAHDRIIGASSEPLVKKHVLASALGQATAFLEPKRPVAPSEDGLALGQPISDFDNLGRAGCPGTWQSPIPALEGVANHAAFENPNSKTVQRYLYCASMFSDVFTIEARPHAWRSLRFQNAIWHAFVLAAACCHYAAVLFCVANGWT